jgi:hypothetical protein
MVFGSDKIHQTHHEMKGYDIYVVYNKKRNGTNEDIIVLCQVTETPDAMSRNERQPQETERERRIRLGEMTPFGSVLGNQLTSADR